MSGIVVKLDGVTLTAPAWLVKPAGDLDLGSAADGSGTTGSLLIDDQDGTRRVRGWQKIEIDEPACTLANNGLMDAPRLFTGYAGRRTYMRGPYKSGAGRYILVELLDLNILLTTRLITGGDAVRPEETDTARLAWLIGSDYLDGLVQDLGLVNGTGLLFDADNTHGQYPMQVLQDLTSTYDQLFFVYWDQSAEAAGLFFDFPSATTNTSPLSISNDLDDVNLDDVWSPHLDGSLDADPAEVWSNIRGVFSGGVIYLTRQSTADEFFTDNDLLRRGTQVEWPKIGKRTTAITFGTRFLDAAHAERISITCTVRLPATHVNLLDSGMRVPVKFTHLPDYGFDSLQYMRVQNRQVSQLDAFSTQAGELDRWYDVKVTLALTGLSTVGSGGGGTGDVPNQPPSGASSVVQTGCGYSLGGTVEVIFDNPVTAGHMIVVAIAWRDGSTDETAVDTNPGIGTTHNFVAFTEIDRTEINSQPTEEMGMFYRVVTVDDFIEGPGTTYSFGAGAGSGRPKMLAWELAGVGAPDAHQVATNGTGTSFNLPSLAVSGAGITIGAAGLGSDSPEPATMTPNDHFYVEAGDHFWQTIIGIDHAHTVAGSQVYGVTFTVSGGGNEHDGIVAYFPNNSSETSEPPPHGTPEPTDTLTPAPDGSTTVFHTTSGNPYAAGSLRVEMNGVDLERGVDYTESDNVSGEVTFTDPPPTGANVNIWYQGL